jgi:tetratricopeptide (TPR) repeat protein
MPKFQFYKNSLILFVLLFTGIIQGFSQTNEDLNLLLENLLKKDFRQIPEQSADTVQFKKLLIQANRCTENRNDSVFTYAAQAVIQAEKAGLIPRISEALELLGEYSMSKENFSEAIKRYLQALKLEERLGNEKRMADFYDLLGAVYFYQEIFPKALEYNRQALSIYQNLKDTVNSAKVLNHLGSLYNSRQYCEKRTPEQTKADYETALDYYQQSLNLLEKVKFEEGIVNAWSNIGNLYRRMGKLDQALEYVQKAITYYRETKNDDQLPGTLRMLGLIYNRQQKYDLALACLLESKEIGEREKRTDGIQFLYEDIAQTYDL